MNRQEKRQALKEIKKRRRKSMKKYDITDKLSFDKNPEIELKGETFEINADAKTILDVSILMQEENAFAGAWQAYEKLFSESDRKKIEKHKLQAADFMAFMNAAITLAMGGDPDEKGEE